MSIHAPPDFAIRLCALRRLWVAIVLQAVADISYGNPGDARDAAEWLQSDEEEPGCFAWACALLEVDVGRARGQLQGKIDRVLQRPVRKPGRPAREREAVAA